MAEPMGMAIPQADKDRLVEAARVITKNAYIPYSNYAVGAALLLADGSIVTGVNIENATYPATICAERVAIAKAVSEGRRDFRAIAVVTDNGGSPCGICRQVMNEFAPHMLVIIADHDRIHEELTVDQLLPLGFGPAHLGVDPHTSRE